MVLLESALNIIVASMLMMGLPIEDQQTQQETYCGAQNIYHESRGEPDIGQVAVAHVVRNRVNSPNYPNSVCAVIWQTNQFSWTSDGRADDPDLDNTITRDAFIKAAWIHLVANDNRDITNGALFYYAHDKVFPVWAKDKEVMAIIGQHTFLK